MSPDPSAILAAVLRLRAELDGLEALVRGDATRPPAPTRAWCLPSPGVVRWDGEAVLPLRRWHLLDALLSRALPVPVTDLESVTGDVRDAAFRMALSRLNRGLESVRWPVCYHVRRGEVVAE